MENIIKEERDFLQNFGKEIKEKAKNINTNDNHLQIFASEDYSSIVGEMEEKTGIFHNPNILISKNQNKEGYLPFYYEILWVKTKTKSKVKDFYLPSKNKL